MDPLKHQPSGYADFSKIYNTENFTITWTNLDTRETETQNIKNGEIPIPFQNKTKKINALSLS